VAKHCTDKAHVCSLVGDVYLKDARIAESNKQRQSLLEAYYVTFCSYTRREITEKDTTFQGEEKLKKIPKFFTMIIKIYKYRQNKTKFIILYHFWTTCFDSLESSSGPLMN